MNTSNNITYNSMLTTLSVFATVGLSFASAQSDIVTKPNYIAGSSYDRGVDYSTNKQSTVDSSTIKNDIEMLRLLEIESFSSEFKSKFDTSIVNTWIPADGILEKSCLFVTLDNQEELMNSSEDFELDLYLALEEKINQSNFFDMIALI